MIKSGITVALFDLGVATRAAATADAAATAVPTFPARSVSTQRLPSDARTRDLINFERVEEKAQEPERLAGGLGRGEGGAEGESGNRKIRAACERLIPF